MVCNADPAKQVIHVKGCKDKISLHSDRSLSGCHDGEGAGGSILHYTFHTSD